MKRTSLSHRDRRAIILGLVILGPALGYVGVVRPYADALADAREQVAVDRAALARERALLAFAPRSAAFQSALDSLVSASKERLFGAPDDGIAAAELGSYLARLARQNQVWLRAAEPGEATTSPSGVRALPMDIQAQSDFEGLLSFLRALERGTKLLRVDRLDITPGTDSSASRPVLEMRAVVTGYALRQAPPDPAPRGRQP